MTLESERKLIHYALNDREITEEQLLSLIILFALSQRMFEKLCGVKFYANRLTIIRIMAR